MWLCLLDLSWPVSTRLLWRPTAHWSGRKECDIWTFLVYCELIIRTSIRKSKVLEWETRRGQGKAGRFAFNWQPGKYLHSRHLKTMTAPEPEPERSNRSPDRAAVYDSIMTSDTVCLFAHI